jgi:hypothetical protein
VDAAAESVLMKSEQQLLGDFQQARAALDRSSTESYFLQQGDDPWRRELDSLNRELDEVESGSSLFQ